MEIINPKEKIYFLSDTAEIISAITKKYQLIDSPEKFIEKLNKNEPFVIPNGVILEATLKLVKKELSEKEAALMIQKSLVITEKIAGEIINEIKTQLIPLATNKKPVNNLPPEQTEAGEKILPKIKSPIGVAEILEKNTPKPTEGLGSPVNGTKKILPNTKQIIDEEIESPSLKSTQPKGPDTYREPIE